MRKIVSVILALLFATLLVVGISGISGAKKVIRMLPGDALAPRERMKADVIDPPQYFWTLEKEYEKLHPEIDIQFIKPVGEYVTWLTTQLIGGTAPEIVWEWAGFVRRSHKKGWFLNLAPYLEEPNPYIEGNEHWLDTFIPGAQATMTYLGSDKIYGINAIGEGTTIAYNKDIFAKVGVTVPTTWKEFIDIQEKIKNAGYTPFGFAMGPAEKATPWSLTLAERLLQDMIMDSKLSEIKGVERPIGHTIKDYIAKPEAVQAFKKGIYSYEDPQWQEIPRLIKEWSKYWPKGYLSDLDCYRLLVMGKVAMTWLDISHIKILSIDPLRKFDFGTFECPTVTKESSVYATGSKAPALGEISMCWVVPTTTKEHGLADIAVDWLRFVTIPENMAALSNQAFSCTPVMEGAEKELSPLLKSFYDAPRERGMYRMASYPGIFTPEFGNKYYELFQKYLSDRLTLSQLADELQKAAEIATAE